MKIVSLTSGGIDSFVMNAMFQKEGIEVHPIFINYGQLGMQKEYTSFINVCEYLKLKPETIDLSNFGKYIQSGITNDKMDVVEEAFLPNRNLLFLTLASSYAYQNDIYQVAIGIIDNHIFSDQTKAFLEATEKCLRESLEVDIKIVYPLKKLNKLDIYKLASELDLPLEIIYYCHVGGPEPCNRCLACQEHVLAKKQIKKIDGTGY